MIQNLPPEADGLGEPLGEYKDSSEKGCAVILLIGMLLFNLCSISIAIPPRLDSRAVVGLAFVLLIVSAASIYGSVRMWRKKGTRIVAYENGLTHTDEDHTDVIHWDDITYVWQNTAKITDENLVFPPSGARQTRLELTDGKHINVLGGFTSPEEIGTIIRARSLPSLLRRTAEAYDRGEAVPFGPIGLSQSGISYRKRSIPWEQVAGAVVDEGKVTVFQTFGDRVTTLDLIRSEGRGRKWCALDSDQVPNLMPLLILVRTIPLLEEPASVQLSDLLAQAMSQSPQQEPVAEAG